MKLRIVTSAVLALFLSGCGQEEPAKEKEAQKSFGAGVGEQYKGMLDNAQQSVDQMNEQMQHTDQAAKAQRE